MTIRWHPDTCGCIFDVDHNFQNPVAVKQCSRHQGQDVNSVFAAAHGDNKDKNIGLAALEAQGVDIVKDVSWSFDKDGKLEFIDKRAVKDAKFQSVIDAALGAGKATVK